MKKDYLTPVVMVVLLHPEKVICISGDEYTGRGVSYDQDSD